MNNIDITKIDAYMKKSIQNCIISFSVKEQINRNTLISIDEISDEYDIEKTAMLSDKDSNAVFYDLEENTENSKLEDYFSDYQVVKAVKKLTEVEKELLILNILKGYNSVELAKIYNKSEGRIRQMLIKAKNKIKTNYKGEK